jgi:uncharacterized membrane protein YdbT with pleckstrin-like domain
VTLVLEHKPQAISGVSAGTEAEIMTAYPSLAATGMGRAVGRLCEGVLITHGISWPRLLITLPLWLVVVPIALTVTLVLYVVTKISGQRFVLTNRNLQVRQMIGVRLNAQAPLADIKNVQIREQPGQAFYKAADLLVQGADGKTLISLEGVQRPAVLRQTILEARDAQQQVAESLKTIQSRKI